MTTHCAKQCQIMILRDDGMDDENDGSNNSDNKSDNKWGE